MSGHTQKMKLFKKMEIIRQVIIEELSEDKDVTDLQIDFQELLAEFNSIKPEHKESKFYEPESHYFIEQ